MSKVHIFSYLLHGLLLFLAAGLITKLFAWGEGVEDMCHEIRRKEEEEEEENGDGRQRLKHPGPAGLRVGGVRNPHAGEGARPKY